MASKKTLVVINSYNLKTQTNLLYSELKGNEDGSYDTVILDNGSKPENVSEYAYIKFENNVFYSGAFNYALNLAINNKDKYDSIQFIICSLSLTGHNWVPAVRNVMFSTDNVAMVSPSIISNIEDQNAWRQMHCWGLNKPREVRWVDFQCAMFNIEFLEKILPFPDFGISYGYDIYSGIKAEEMGYKVFALDYVYAYHAKKATFKTKDSNMTASTYGQQALQGMYNGFDSIGKTKQLNQFRSWGQTYKPKEL